MVAVAPRNTLIFGMVINQMSLMKKNRGYKYLAVTFTWNIPLPQYSFGCDQAVKMAFYSGFVVACVDKVVVLVETKEEYFRWNIFLVD